LDQDLLNNLVDETVYLKQVPDVKNF